MAFLQKIMNRLSAKTFETTCALFKNKYNFYNKGR